MSPESTQITLGVSAHWILGSLPLAGMRIQEALNDCNTHFVKISGVQIHTHSKYECVANLPEVVVPKCKIEFVVPSSNEHEAPEKRLTNYTGKALFKSLAILNDYRICGSLHLPMKSVDPWYTLTQQLGRFFPLTDATLSNRGVKQLGVPLLFANRDFVSCFHVGDPAQTSDRNDSNLAELLENVHATLGKS